MPPATALPPAIGRFQIRGVLGAGAFGTVYRALDSRLQREVALKVAHPGSLDDVKRAQRFEREARATAKLRHPNIVPVFDVGVDQGRHYIAATFIDGKTLGELIANERPDFAQTARLIRTLALALDHAHQHGIIHRDVKPDNVRVDARGEPHLLDFGIAHLLESSEQLTHDGAVLGTASYMAPEQARGQTGKPLPASDQYSLGVVFYELLTGRTPFRGTTATDLIVQLLTREPESPRAVNRRVPRDLETICLKALAKAPEDRYPSCAALAEDLRRWLEDEPIQARRLGVLERAGRWMRREPVLALSSLGAAVGLLAAAIVPLVLSARLAARNAEAETARKNASARTEQAQREVEEAHKQTARAAEAKKTAAAAKKRADDEKIKAETAEKSAAQEQEDYEKALKAFRANEQNRPHFQYIADMQLAQHYFNEPNYVELDKRLAPYGPGKNATAESRKLADFTWRYFRTAHKGQPTALPDRLRNAANRVLRWSPDGKTLVVLGWVPGEELSMELRSADLAQREFQEARSFKADFAPLATGGFLSADGRSFVDSVSATRSQVRRLQGNKWVTVQPLLQHEGSLEQAVFSPDGKHLATIHHNEKNVRLWTIGETVKPDAVWKVPAGKVRYSADGKTLAAVSPTAIHLWDFEAHAEKSPLAQRAAYNVVFSPNGERLAVVLFAEVTLWNLRARNQERQLQGANPLEIPQFSPDGTLLAVLSRSGRVKVWDVASGSERGAFPSRQVPGADVRSCVWSPDSRRLVTWKKTGGAMLWDVPGARLWRVLTKAKEIVAAAVFAADGRLILALDDGTVRVWKRDQLEAPEVLEGFAHPVAALGCGKTIVVAAGHGVERLEPRTGTTIDRLPTSATVTALALSVRGNRLAAGCSDGRVFVWDAATGKPLDAPAVAKGAAVAALQWSPAGDVLAVGRADGSLTLHNGSTAVVCSGHTDAVRGVAFAPDGRLASASDDGSVRLWDRSGKAIATLREKVGPVNAVAVSVDGKTLVSAGEDGTIHFLEVETQKERAVTRGHKGPVLAAVFEPEGKTLATAGTDGTIRLWDVNTTRELAALQGHTDAATCLAFSADGTLLVTGSKDKTVRFWHAPRE